MKDLFSSTVTMPQWILISAIAIIVILLAAVAILVIENRRQTNRIARIDIPTKPLPQD